MTTDTAAQGVDMARDLRRQNRLFGTLLDHPRQVRTGLGEDGEVLLALVDLDLENSTAGRAGGGKDAENIDLGHLFAAAVGLVLPGQAGGRLDGRDNNPQHVQGPARLAAISRQPGLLQPTQGNGRSGIAGQHDKAGTFIEQPDAAGPGEINNLLARTAAIGRIGLIGEIDEVGGRKPLDQRAVHGQAADTGIEDANGHELALALRPPGVHAVHYSPFM